MWSHRKTTPKKPVNQTTVVSNPVKPKTNKITSSIMWFKNDDAGSSGAQASEFKFASCVSQHFRRTGTMSTILWTLVRTSRGNVSWDMDITTNVVSKGRIQQLQQAPSAIKKNSFPRPPTCLNLSHTSPFLNPKQWGPDSTAGH